jgi:urease accessory protein
MSASPLVRPARTGWRAELSLAVEARGGRSVVTRSTHLGPLLTQRQFYAADGVCHIYIVHPPGVIVGGDELEIGVEVGSDARALLTTPAAGKFHRSAADAARLQQRLRVEADGELEWLPQENIFYPGCLARLGTYVELTGSSKFIGWEMTCFGLPARQAAFDAGEVCQRFEIWRDGRPLLIECVLTDPHCVRPKWGLSGLPATGTLLASPANTLALQQLRDVEVEGVTRAGSLLEGVLVCRALAAHAHLLRRAFVEVWSRIRPVLLKRAAVPPRIWAT